MTKKTWAKDVTATKDAGAERTARYAAPSGETVDAILASTRRQDLKVKNLDHAKGRQVVLDGGDLNFGAIQLHEDTIRAIAEECRFTKYLKSSERDPKHLRLSSITKESGQLYTQPLTNKDAMVPDAGSHVRIKRPQESKGEYHLAVGKFMSEITRLREGLFAIAEGKKPELVSQAGQTL